MTTAKDTPSIHAPSIHAFSAGEHITAAGQKVSITAEDLNASAQAYNPELHEAPIVIGHPTGEAPAYGWIKSFVVQGKEFIAQPTQVNLDFAELNNSGAFKKRSMSFYHPENKANPAPGVWYPRHLGFLGAQPPAVKGLRDFNFQEDDGDSITIDQVNDVVREYPLGEFAESEDRVEAGVFRSLREWILAKFGKEDADAAIPIWDVDLLQEAAVKQEEEPTTSFSENSTEDTMTPEEKAAAQAELDAQKTTLDTQAADFAEREKALAKREQAAHHTTCAEFTESLVADGKVLPVQKDNLIEFMAGLEHVETVEFGEGDKAVSQTPLSFMQDFLSAMPKVVSFGEHDEGSEGSLNLDDAPALAKAAVEFKEQEKQAGRDISITAAVDHISEQNGGSK